MRKIIEVALELLDPHPENRPIETSAEAWTEFVECVRARGVQVPLLARKVGPRYQIIDGERRWRAAGEAGITTLELDVRKVSEAEALEMILVGIIHRIDMDPLSEAIMLARISKARGSRNPEELGRVVGKPAEWISLRQGILELPPTARDAVRDRLITLPAAAEILKVPGEHRGQAVQLVLHAEFTSEPLTGAQARDVLEARIMAPCRRQARWEAEGKELAAEEG